MKPFWISEIVERYGEKTLYVNPLPAKYCTFDCVFCPVGERTAVKTEDCCKFTETDALLLEMEEILKTGDVDKVFICPDGEGLANADLGKIIDLAKRHGCGVKIITNGYLLNHVSYRETMLKCDVVIGELMTVTEEDFQRLQRPLEGYSLQAYLSSMENFRKDYKGEFNLSITLLKNYSDNEAALRFFTEAAARLMPDNIYVETPEDGKLQQVFGVDEKTLEHFNAVLNNR